MTIIAFISQKGGVGKSTLSQALATEASQQKLKTTYTQYQNTEEWLIIEYLLKELENNQDIELKTVPEYVIGYLVEKLRNKDLLKSK